MLENWKAFKDASLVGKICAKILFYQNRFPLDLFSDFVYITNVWVVDICGAKHSKAQISIFEFENKPAGRSENEFFPFSNNFYNFLASI